MNGAGAQPSSSSPQTRGAPNTGFPLTDRQAIARLWDELRRLERLPAIDKWLEERFRQNKKYGKRDRQQIRDAIFTVFRFAEALVLAVRDDLPKQFHEHAASVTPSVPQTLPPPQPSASFSNGSPAELLAELFQLTWQDLVTRSLRVKSVLVEPAAELIKGASSPVSEPRNGSTEQTLESALLRHGIPRAYAGALRERAWRSRWRPEQLAAFVSQHADPAPLWLRVNTLRSNPEALLKNLLLEAKQAGIKPFATPPALVLGDDRLKIKWTTSLYDTQAFRAGFFEIQDFASQEIGRHAFSGTSAEASKTPRFIWDVCAGAGGKSLQLATLLENRGAVFCTDIRTSALKELQRRTRRHGLTNIRSQIWDGKSVPPLPKAVARNGGFDLVFVDAPCSSSGTWRRNPEARFRLDQPTLQSFQDTQVGLLHLVANSVAPGGSLVYATCSWLCAENEDVISRFLNETEQPSSFEVESQRLHGSPAADADCMFSARLVRKRRDPGQSV